MDKKMLRLSLFVLLFGLIISFSSAADKNKPKTLDTDPNLAGWWKFDEASGKTTPDSSGHGRNGMLKEDLSFDKDSAKGRTGKALKFDDNGYVEITKYKGVTGTQARTVAAWIKTDLKIADALQEHDRFKNGSQVNHSIAFAKKPIAADIKPMIIVIITGGRSLTFSSICSIFWLLTSRLSIFSRLSAPNMQSVSSAVDILF